eukprot:Amastigsp_a189_752.p6 type:complete len:100 gc:universal Amastigsp_a189_752:473-174(-)
MKERDLVVLLAEEHDESVVELDDFGHVEEPDEIRHRKRSRRPIDGDKESERQPLIHEPKEKIARCKEHAGIVDDAEVIQNQRLLVSHGPLLESPAKEKV